MVGRAGRYGMSKLPADAYTCVMASRRDSEWKYLKTLMEISAGKKPLGQVISALSFERRGMYRIILDALGNGLVRDQIGLVNFLKRSLFYYQKAQGGADAAWDALRHTGKAALNFLVSNEILSQDEAD